VALDVLHWRSEARLDHGAHFVPTLLDRPSFRSHVGGGEGDVQVVIVVQPGGFENIGKSRAGPLGHRYCPMLHGYRCGGGRRGAAARDHVRPAGPFHSRVKRDGGTLSQFTGDDIMAVFGVAVALEDHAIRACLGALGIQEEAQRLAAGVQDRDGIDLRLRVGLNSGQVIAGEIGSGSFGYTAIGEQVGMAWRQRNPAGGVALSTGTAIDVTGAAGGVVVVVVAPSVAARTAPTMPVLACLLATATPTAPAATTALAPTTADNNLTLF
jgi:Adenylate and Guanylate cyclase catalytic domain